MKLEELRADIAFRGAKIEELEADAASRGTTIVELQDDLAEQHQEAAAVEGSLEVLQADISCKGPR